MKTSNVIFSRRRLTQRQKDELPQADETVDCSTLAKKDIIMLYDAIDIINEIMILTKGYTIRIFGDIPASIRAMLYERCKTRVNNKGTLTIETYESFKVKQKEGNKLIFEHMGWLLTGEYTINY